MWQQARIQENHCMLHQAAHDGSQLLICNSPRIRWGHQHIVLAPQIWCPCQFNWPCKHVLKNHPCKRKRRERCLATKPHHLRDLQRAARSSKKSPIDPVETVVADWFTLIRITGLCCAEYAQKTQTSYDKHKYPLDKHVVKAFISSDWKFYNSKGRLIIDPMEIPKKLTVTFWIQKNRQNGQSITLVADDAHHNICLVWAAYCIFLRAKNLGQSDSEPMGFL